MFKPSGSEPLGPRISNILSFWWGAVICLSLPLTGHALPENSKSSGTKSSNPNGRCARSLESSEMTPPLAVEQLEPLILELTNLLSSPPKKESGVSMEAWSPMIQHTLLLQKQMELVNKVGKVSADYVLAEAQRRINLEDSAQSKERTVVENKADSEKVKVNHLSLQPKLIHSISVEKNSFLNGEFLPDGQTLVVSSVEEKYLLGAFGGFGLSLWDITRGDKIKQLKHPLLSTFWKGHSAAVSTSALAPDGKTLATVGEDGKLILWDVQTGAYKKTLIGHKGKVLAVAFSPNSRWIVTGGSDRIAVVWNVESGSEKYILDCHEHWVTAVGFSPDGHSVLTSNMGKIYSWHLGNGRLEYAYSSPRHTFESFSFSSDGQRLIGGSTGGTLVFWKKNVETPDFELEINKNADTTVACIPNSPYVIAASGFAGQGQLAIYHQVTGELIFMDQKRGRSTQHYKLSISPDRRFLSVQAGLQIEIWSLYSAVEID